MDHSSPQSPRPAGLGLPLVMAPTPGAIDLVCGMTVDPASAAGSVEHEGKKYYFCSPHCVHKFRADPKRYLHPDANPEPMPVAPAAAPPGGKVEYICPMDPEIVRDRPGSCPKCGMALEPRVVSAEEGPNPELVDMRRRFWIGLILTVPLLALHLAYGWHPPYRGWLELA